MTERVVILGGGTAGTLTANRLRKERPDAHVVVVDSDDDHVYQPGLLFVPFGRAEPGRLVRSRRRQLRHGVAFRRTPIDRVDVESSTVHLTDGSTLGYDVLVVATGATLLPDETPGLTGPGWGDTVHTFYTLDGAVRLRDALDRFTGGRIAVNVVDMPIKCPVAPLEFSFLADEYFRRRGIRDRVELSYVTPLDAAFTKPVAARQLAGLLAEKHVTLVTDFNTGEVDGTAGTLTAYDGRELGFDLAVVIPLHGGAAYVGRSPGLGDALNFVPVDERTLQSKVAPNVFAIGDATDVRASKAGSVAHFQGETLVHNIGRFLDGEPLDAGFDGHANCFVETGDGKALLIDFNYDVEPLPGHYPGAVGLPLLKQSRLNHAAKRMFAWFYWHGLLPGRDVPGISAAMPRAGKPMGV